MTLFSKDKEETVMREGDEGDLFYFILSGECEIRIPDYDRKKKYDERKF